MHRCTRKAERTALREKMVPFAARLAIVKAAQSRSVVVSARFQHVLVWCVSH